MNTQELTTKVAKEIGISQTSAKQIVRTVFESITNEVGKGHKVSVTGFGTFTRAHRKARVGRNPQTGAELKIPAVKYPKFRAGSSFKDSVR